MDKPASSIENASSSFHRRSTVKKTEGKRSGRQKIGSAQGRTCGGQNNRTTGARGVERQRSSNSHFKAIRRVRSKRRTWRSEVRAAKIGTKMGGGKIEEEMCWPSSAVASENRANRRRTNPAATATRSPLLKTLKVESCIRSGQPAETALLAD